MRLFFLSGFACSCKSNMLFHIGSSGQVLGEIVTMYEKIMLFVTWQIIRFPSQNSSLQFLPFNTFATPSNLLPLVPFHRSFLFSLIIGINLSGSSLSCYQLITSPISQSLRWVMGKKHMGVKKALNDSLWSSELKTLLHDHVLSLFII